MIRNLIPSAVVIEVAVALWAAASVCARMPAPPVTVLVPDGNGGFIYEARDAHSVAVEQAKLRADRLGETIDGLREVAARREAAEYEAFLTELQGPTRRARGA